MPFDVAANFWGELSCAECTGQGNESELIPTVKLETRRLVDRDVTRLGLGGAQASPQRRRSPCLQTETGISLFYTAVLDIMLL